MARHFGGAPVRGGSRSTLIKVMIVMFVAFLFLFAFLFVNSRKQQSSAVVVDNQPGVREVQVLIPVTDVKPGTPLNQSMFAVESKPQMLVDDRTIRDFAQVNGYYAKTLILKGRPLHADFITLEKPTSPISQMIPPGYRAVTISIDKIRGVEGWATPGSKVDVYWSSTNQGTTSLNVIVENAQVLSTDRRVSPDTPVDAPVPGTVTLLVNTQDAKKISLATSTGSISLALRSDNDTLSTGPSGIVTTQDLFYGGNRQTATVVQEEPCSGTLVVDGKEFCVGRNGKLKEVKSKAVEAVKP